MSVITLTTENFKEQVLEAQQPVLVDFYATWCGPCRMVSPIVDEIAEECPQYRVGKIDVDQQGALAQQYNVMSIPTLLVFKNGEITATQIGSCSKEELLALLEK